MKLGEYENQIEAASSARVLWRIRQNAAVDGDLSAGEQRAVAQAVNRRFGRLNQLAVGPQKPRW